MVGGRTAPPVGSASATPAVWRAVAASLGGPVLIVACVLIVLHAFVFSGSVTQGDVSTFFLPSHCFLGRSLAAGHVPGWNPYTLGGLPFAADPQSGWMSLLPMALFTALPCAAAMQVTMAALPVIAGVALYGFLRTEGLSRPSATVGGLTLAMAISGSELVTSLPFAGTLAWTSATLWAGARAIKARQWWRRVAWIGGTAILWGQLAAAHLSVGLLIGSTALVAYLGAALVRAVRGGAGWSGRGAVVGAAVLVGALVALNLAFALPRLTYLPRTELSLGYGRLVRLGATLAGQPAPAPAIGPAAAPDWPLDLAASPAAHVAALALGLSFAAFWTRRRRWLALVFAGFGLATYLLSLRAVAGWVLRVAPGSRLADLYLRRPDWTGYGLLLALAVLAALGLESWLGAASARDRVRMVVPGLVVWGLLPAALGGGLRLVLLAAGAVAGGVVLLLRLRRGVPAALIPVVVAAELVLNGLMGYRALPFLPAPVLLVELPEPTISLHGLLSPGPIERTLPRLPTGRVLAQDLPTWNRLQADPMSSVFGYEEAQGYNPTVPVRTWLLARALSPDVLAHNLTVLDHPGPVLRDLLQVRYVIAPGWPFAGAHRGPLIREGGLGLFAFAETAPRASVIGRWTVVGDRDAALAVVADPAFDPSATVVLERDPGLGAAGPGTASGGTAVYRAVGTQEVRIDVRAAGDGLVLVRDAYDPGWHATVDGRPASLLAADVALRAVPVTAGQHQVVLRYDDPSVGVGLLGSAAGLALLVGSVLILRRREPRPS